MSGLTVFVACPYNLFPMDDYKKVFNSISRSYHVSFKFADEQITGKHILTKITNYIRDHDISLFDITGWNPNVALELGIAMGLAKPYFILFNTKIDAGREVPSDIRGIDRIQYISNSELQAKLILLIKEQLPPEPGRSDSAFDSIKERIEEALRRSPGLNLSRLVEAIGEDKTLVQSTVRVLVQSGDLTTKGQRRGTTYFAKGVGSEQALKKRIILTIKKYPGSNIRYITDTLEEEQITVSSAMRTLVQEGKIRTRGNRRGMTYYSRETDFRTLPRSRLT